MPTVITVQLPGSPGPPGPPGNPGGANFLTMGTVTTGAEGSTASAAIIGESPNQVLNLTIPRGNAGPQGDPGVTPTFTAGTITTLAAGSNATWAIVGTGPNYTMNLSIPRGATGLTGPANSLSIGTVTTGTAAASITGTAPTQTLNLTLPKGDKGDKGDPGPAGTAVGLPPGGANGYVLAKASAADYDTTWVSAPTGGGGSDPALAARVDNVELDLGNATLSNAATAIVRRGASGEFSAGLITSTGTPTAAGHLIRKDYADAIGARVTTLEAGVAGNSDNVANAIVKRDSSGRIAVGRAYAETPVPAAVNELTRKDYVDSKIPTVEAGTNVSVSVNESSGHPVYTISASGGGAGSTTATAMPGTITFDSFAGATTNEKIATMNEFLRLAPGSPTPTILFNAQVYTFNTPIKLFSGMKLQGAAGLPAREYGRSTQFKWNGASGTSMFIFPPEGQTGQGYPSDGSPRDIGMYGIEFRGTASTHWFEKLSTFTSGKVLWISEIHNCGWNSWSTIWHGYADNVSISGPTHFQAITDTAFSIGGAENYFFTNGAQSVGDTSTVHGKPLFIDHMDKSTIGTMMFTSRQSNYALLIDGGKNHTFFGTQFDAQSSDPTYGAGVKITGGEGISFIGCSFKGMGTTPASGAGGASSNKAWVHISGGRNISFNGNNFQREGTNMPATSYPLIYVGTGANEVKWGANNVSGWGGAGYVLQQASAGKIWNMGDPQSSITTAA